MHFPPRTVPNGMDRVVESMYLLVVAETRVLYQNDVPSPLGTVRVVAEQRATRGLSPGPMRVFGGYALVLLHSAGGRYRDPLTKARDLRAGDAIVVLPDVPHTYATRKPQGWDETFVTFDGPAFETLRATGVLVPGRPIFPTDEAWRRRFLTFAHETPVDATGRLRHTGELFGVLVDLLATSTDQSVEEAWVAAAKSRLERDLELPLDLDTVAAEMQMSAQAFRKRFSREAGVSPARYRADRRVAAAANLLRQTTMSHRQIAMSLGFTDEFHLAKRFRREMGITPSDYRRQGLG